MRISIIGSGYVGLVSAVGFASVGHQVICVDKRDDIVASINNGVAPIHEDGLPEILAKNVPHNIRATSDLKSAVSNSDVTFIAVGTPTDSGQIDLSYIEGAAREIGEVLKAKDSYHVVVVKSTVVPGTTDGLVTDALEQASGKKSRVDFGVAMNPEFLREGVAVKDFMNPDRIVLGGDSVAIGVLSELYSAFANVPMIKTTATTAELIKYCSNSFFAMLISFANEFANLSSKCSADALEVIRGLTLDRRFQCDAEERVGLLTYLHPGCGYGGSCFPKDVQAITAFGDSVNNPMHLTAATHKVNVAQIDKMLEIIEQVFDPALTGDVVILGLSFKPNTDDVRESVGIRLANELVQKSVRVRVCDELAKTNASSLLDPGIQWVTDVSEINDVAQVVVVVTLSDQFTELPKLLADSARQPIIVDARRSFKSDDFERYAGIGYPAQSGLL